MFKKQFSGENIFTFFILLLVFSIPFGTKKFLFSFYGAPSEEHSVFLFGLDIGIVLLALLAWQFGLFKKIGAFTRMQKTILGSFAIFLVLALVSVLFAPITSLAVYAWARLLLAALFFLCIFLVLSSGTVSFRALLAALGLSAVFQAAVSFFQFLHQGSVGLSFLGESVINHTTTGVARIFVDGTYLLRAYGTMPHANILAGFLVMGLLSLVYLWMAEPRRERSVKLFGKDFFRHLAVAVGIFSILLALVLTFSRSGWIVAIVGAGGMLLMGFLKKEEKMKTGYLAILLTLVVVFLGYLMWFAISPRVERLTMEDPSVRYRVLYNELGTRLLSVHPFGVGIGSQVLTSMDEGLYTKFGITRAIDWQPVHNLYLLVAAETGILGAVCFGVFLVLLVWGAVRILGDKEKRIPPGGSEFDLRVALMMLLGLLIFGLFDHFLWTLESGRLMLWLAAGLLFGIELLAGKAKKGA